MVSFNLRGDEKILFEGQASWSYYWASIVLGIIFTITTVIIGLIIFLFVYLSRIQTEYVITNKRVFSRYGLISRQMRDATLDKITDSYTGQPMFGRILNYGDVNFNTAGSGGFEIQFKGVTDPLRIREIAQSAEEQSKTAA